MKVGDSVRKAIDDWRLGDLDSAMLHACNAVDGTAAKVYPHIKRNADRFTGMLRDNYSILGIMGMPGINLEGTRFPVKVRYPTAPDGKPDLADLIYGIHRCSHGHGDELPQGFELIRNADGPPEVSVFRVRKGTVQLSDRIIFGLLAVAVFSPVNVGQVTPDSYFLTLGESHTFVINQWWGRASEFLQVASTFKLPSVTMNFGDWLE